MIEASTYLGEESGAATVGRGGGETLTQTRNFLALYLKHVGHSDVPVAYHKWACLSLLAALVRDRVWVEKYVDIPLTPHLFVFLIGESGTGKDLAARVAQGYLKHAPAIRAYVGKTSSAAFIDFMRKRQRKPGSTEHFPPDPRVWLITTELAHSIGSGGQADAFLKSMTDLYSGKDDNVPWRESTRHAGIDKKLTKPLINWFAGTTREWLCQVVTIEDIRGGFFARICPVEVTVPTTQTYKPTRPLDYEYIREHLFDRVENYVNAEGIFTMSEEAEAIDRPWVEQRPAPADDRMRPTWRRQHEQVLKLAQLYALCDWETLDQPFVIEAAHIVQAQRDVATFLKTTEQLLAYAASRNVDAAAMILVSNLIKEKRSLRHSHLLRLVYKDGISAELLHRIVQTLIQAGEIKVHTVNVPGTRAGNGIYVWAGGRRISHKEAKAEGVATITTEEEDSDDANEDRDD